MSKGPVASIFGLLAIALIAAGCGGGGDTTSTTATLTKAEFLKQGNQVCAEGNKEINAGYEEFLKKNHLSHKNQPTKAQKEELAETVVLPGIAKQVEGVKALGAPSGEEEQVDAIVEGAEEALEEAEEDPAAFVSEEGGDPFKEVDKLTSAYGLTACSEGE
ncbi:MAG TPA: hypothetical protein VH476_00940 [Solirubrobacterales bacterium]